MKKIKFPAPKSRKWTKQDPTKCTEGNNKNKSGTDWRGKEKKNFKKVKERGSTNLQTKKWQGGSNHCQKTFFKKWDYSSDLWK